MTDRHQEPRHVPGPATPESRTAAPEFVAWSAQGPVRLSDHAGRWVVLFGHLAADTPAWLEDFLDFVNAGAAFREQGAQLLCVPLAARFSHLDWLREFEAAFGRPPGFPLLATPNDGLTGGYPLLERTGAPPGAQGIYVIDPEQRIRVETALPLRAPELLFLLKSAAITRSVRSA